MIVIDVPASEITDAEVIDVPASEITDAEVY